ncbi:MAG: type II toxin-antitoxin system RelE family toxin [Terriglobales bacterium]
MASREILIARSAARYLEHLDRPTRERMHARIREIAAEPENLRYSRPLKNTDLRSAHVGGWRILCRAVGSQLLVTDIEPRGQVYRNLQRR